MTDILHKCKLCDALVCFSSGNACKTWIENERMPTWPHLAHFQGG